MIFDSLANASIYRSLSPNLAKAIAFLQSQANLELPVGRYEIDRDRVFALVQEYQTKPRSEGFWEAHRHYTDVQFVVRGIELMSYAPVETLHLHGEYNPEKDFSTFTGPASQQLTVGEQQFAIFFPHDAHQPQLAFEEPSPVRKIVIKVSVD